MFSNFIQNFINSSGQNTAMQRYVEINNRVANMPGNQSVKNPLDNIYPTTQTTNTDSPSFDKVLQSQMTDFGSLLISPKTKKVSAEISATTETPAPATISEAVQQISGSSQTKPINSKSQILNLVSKISERHGVDEKLVQALIKQESAFNPDAKSSAGAMGLMQLMPATAKSLGVKDAYNPVQNVDGGVRYLKSMLEKYNGNVILALAAYNAGPGNVDKYDGVPPFKETQNYVKNILSNYL
ncbi:MAG: lytic transglycosylase domain-containing protein [Candidatus Gastranaerophilales bacterium]